MDASEWVPPWATKDFLSPAQSWRAAPGLFRMEDRQRAWWRIGCILGDCCWGRRDHGVWNDVSTMTDRLGTAVTGYPYGTDKVNSPGNDQPDFATYTEDGTTGFEYANHRYYSAGLGRFLSVDPYGNSAQLDSPESWNRYTYASDDPVGSFDPFGLGNCTPDDLSGCGGNWSVTVSSGNGGQANFLADDTGNTTACPHGSLGKKDGGSSNCDGRNPTTPVARFTTSVPCQTIASQALSGSSLQKFSQAVESFASSLVNAITGFEQFQDGTQGAATMTWQWATGTGPDSQVFDPSSQQSADMAVSVLVGNAVSKYLSTGKFYGGESFGLNELVAAGINPTQQFVGSFSYSIGNRGDGNITLDLWNNTSFTSLTYGKGPSWTRSQFGPGGNMSQEYMITMPCK